MEKTAILLNGGRDHVVTPLADADTYLVRLLGSEPAIQAVFFLRSMQDEQGRPRVAIFAGSQHIGYLPAEADTGILAAVKACELHNAAVRARGSMAASWEQPGKVNVKVDLSEPDHLFSSPLSDQACSQATSEPVTGATPPKVSTQIPLVADATSGSIPAPEPANEVEPTSLLSASFEDAAALIDFDEAPGARPNPSIHAEELESSVTPGLSAGWTEDYPEWPPPKTKPLAPTDDTQLPPDHST